MNQIITAQEFALKRAIRDGKACQPQPGFWNSLRSAFTSEEQATQSIKARQDAHIKMWIAESTAELGEGYVRETLKAQLAEIERGREFA